MSHLSEETSISLESSKAPIWIQRIQRTPITRPDLFFLAMTIVIGGQIDDSFQGGFWVILATNLITGVGYILMSFCLAEMTSTLPFSGGIYGFVRAFTNPFSGFYVAVFELLLNLFYAANRIYVLSVIPVYLGAQSHSMILINCLITYFLILIITLAGGKVFWIVNNLLGATVLVLLLIFIFGGFAHINSDYVKHIEQFQIYEFFNSLPDASTSYLGIQFMPLTSKYTSDARKDIPIVMCIAMVVMVFTNIGCNIVASFQAPGLAVITQGEYGMAYGFRNIFHISKQAATWLCLPGYFSTSFGFLYCYGRQASSMAKSGMLPSIFQKELPYLETPFITLLLGCIFSFCFNLMLFYEDNLLNNFISIASYCSFIVFIGGCLAYLQFHSKYTTLSRFFRSPFGKFGAYGSIMIFILCIIGDTGFQQDEGAVIFVVGVSLLIIPIYYFFISPKLMFSDEEKEELFKAYLINANVASKHKVKKKAVTAGRNNKVAPVSRNTNSRPVSIGSKSIPAELSAEEALNIKYTNPQKGDPEYLTHQEIAHKHPSMELPPAESPENEEEIRNSSPVNRQFNGSVDQALHPINTSLKALAQQLLPDNDNDHYQYTSYQVLPNSVGDQHHSIRSTGSLSGKMVEYFSQKLQQFLPEEDRSIKTLVILENGGIISGTSLSATVTVPPNHYHHQHHHGTGEIVMMTAVNESREQEV